MLRSAEEKVKLLLEDESGAFRLEDLDGDGDGEEDE